MKKYRFIRTLAFILAAGIMTAAFSGCKKNNDTVKNGGQKIIAGFSQIGAESAWRTCNTESIKKAAEENGIQLVYNNAEQKQENQIKALRSFIAYQVDVIIFVPIVMDGWDNVLKEAKIAGIPVLVVDRKIKTDSPDLYAGYIGTNGTDEGKTAAEFLKKRFRNISQDLNILEVSGTTGASVTGERATGFRSGISTEEKFKIVRTISGDFLRSKGEEIIDQLPVENKMLFSDSSKNNKVDIIFSHNDAMTLGMIGALKDKGIAPGKDITIVSVDAEQAAIDAIKEGDLNCTVECRPQMGTQVMELVRQLAAKQQIPRHTQIPGISFDDTQDLSEINPRGY